MIDQMRYHNMPGQGHIFERRRNGIQLASVMNFVRNSFGNRAEEVTAEEAAGFLELAKKRDDRWKVKELVREYPLEK